MTLEDGRQRLKHFFDRLMEFRLSRVLADYEVEDIGYVRHSAASSCGADGPHDSGDGPTSIAKKISYRNRNTTSG
jgi:hypothetical protein